MIDYPFEHQEQRRPGILAIIHRLKAEHPRWSWETCVAHAKVEWTDKHYGLAQPHGGAQK